MQCCLRRVWRTLTKEYSYAMFSSMVDTTLYRLSSNIPHVISLGNVGPDRSSHQKCSARKGVLKYFTKFTEKHLYQSLFLNKVASHSDTGVFMWVLQYSKNTFFTDHLWANASAQIDPDKIVNYFFVKSCLRTVDQHYTGKFLVQFWLRHIKTTLYMVIFLRKDDYK